VSTGLLGLFWIGMKGIGESGDGEHEGAGVSLLVLQLSRLSGACRWLVNEEFGF
jgi:hypothetical protein